MHIYHLLIASNMTILVNNLNFKAILEVYPSCLISRSINSHFVIILGHFLAKSIKTMYMTDELPKKTISPVRHIMRKWNKYLLKKMI